MEAETVLLVDDDEELLTLMSWVLEADPSTRGLRIVTACNAREALAIARRDPPDLIVTDLEMPGGDGAELIAGARIELPGVPILLVSASPGLDTVAAALGVEGSLRKPWEVAALCREVVRCLRRDGPDWSRAPADLASRASNLAYPSCGSEPCRSCPSSRWRTTGGLRASTCARSCRCAASPTVSSSTATNG
jgi:CheY-like chemotaxis protein